MATFHENLVQSLHNFRDKYLKANGKYFKFSYDQSKQKYGYLIDNEFNEFSKADFVFDTYAEYQAAHSAGNIPVGSVVYIKEGSTDGTITALQVVYNNGTVKSALDEINASLDVKVIATVTGNGVKTVKTLLTELYQVFSTLSNNDKVRCKLIFATYPLNISNMNGVFDGFRLGADIEIMHVVLSNGTYAYANLSTNPPTVTDSSSVIVPSTVSYKLILI